MKFTDYYLLAVFAAVIEERNYTRVATRLGITQPSVSNNIARLREIYDDPLFIREKLGVRPTSFAQEIYPDIANALAHIEAVSAKNTRFNPKESERVFKVSVVSMFEHNLMPEVFRLIEKEAPYVSIFVDTFSSEYTKDMLIQDKIDLSIEPARSFESSIQSEVIYQDSLVVVCRKSSPYFTSGRITKDQFLNHTHIKISNQSDPRQLSAIFSDLSSSTLSLLTKRNSKKHVASHWGLLSSVATSDDLVVFPKKMILENSHIFSLRILENDFIDQQVEASMHWRTTREQDPAVTWLRNVVSEAAANVFGCSNHS